MKELDFDHVLYKLESYKRDKRRGRSSTKKKEVRNVMQKDRDGIRQKEKYRLTVPRQQINGLQCVGGKMDCVANNKRMKHVLDTFVSTPPPNRWDGYAK